MKSKLFLPFTLALALAARAQTDSPAGNARSLSLNDCIDLALQHNLDLRISRYSPELSVYNLSAARGDLYDPKLTATGSHMRSEVRNEPDSANRIQPTSVDHLDSVSSSLSGSLPWGMSYNLQGNASDRYASGWAFNNTTLAFAPLPVDSASGSASVTLTQPLLKNLWTDSSRLGIAVAKNRVKFSEQSLRQQIITTVSDTENAYYELIFAQENVKVQEKAFQLAEQLFNENKKRVEVGVMAPLDEKQAASQMALRRSDLLSARRAFETSQNNLKKLITDDYAKWHDVLVQPTETLTASRQFFNYQDSWSRGLNERPDLLQAKLDLEQAGIRLIYYQNQIFPQLDLFGTYGRNGTGNSFNNAFSDIRHENQPSYTYGVTFSIPLGNFAARARYKAGKLTVEQALLTLKKSEQGIMVDIDEAIKQAQSSFERVDATRQAREFSEAALDAEQKKLANGKSTSFNVLSLQRDLTAARSAEIRALADYNEALTALAQAEASTLERRKIDLKVK